MYFLKEAIFRLLQVVCYATGEDNVMDLRMVGNLNKMRKFSEGLLNDENILENLNIFYNYKRSLLMKTFPDFIKNSQNSIEASQQNTEDIEGYYFKGADDTQIAFWECHADRISKKHTHPFDEYMVCVSGEYTAYLNEQEVILKPGDELFIPKGTEQWGRCISGTRTIHAFGGKRIKK